MTRKGLRRLDLWLPDNHPIWDLPPGRRAERARELIDLGLRLELGFDTLRQEIANLRLELQALRRDAVFEPGPSSARPAAGGGEAARRFLAAFD